MRNNLGAKSAFAAFVFIVVSFTGIQAQTVLKFWTWFPSADVFKPAIARFEQLHPDIKIELTLLESKNLQEKVPLALATGEDVDVVGMQSGAMANQCAPDLADLDPLLAKYAGADWTAKYSKLDVATSKATTGGVLKYLPMVRFGAMIGYYNPVILKKYGIPVPTTIQDYKKLADTLKARAPGILPAVVNGKDAWTMDEMMLTVMAQGGDYYNQWLYNGAKVDDPHFIDAMKSFKKFFDLGIFSKDVMDFDYGRSQELFTQGKAATYFQGTWESWLLSASARADKKVALEDVGIFALPVVKAGDKPALRSFIDAGAAIPANSKHLKEATEWLAFIMFGEGTDIISHGIVGTFSKVGMKPDPAMFTSRAARDGLTLMNQLVGNPAADRNNVSAYSDVEGASVQKVVMGTSTAEAEVKALQTEWMSGKYAR